MGNFIDCFQKHAGNVLSDGDKESILARIQEHTKAGHTPEEAAKFAVQSHLDEAHEQLKNVCEQAGVKAEKPPAIPMPEDYTPALKTKEGEVVTGKQGQTHDDIIGEQKDPIEFKANDPEHGFVDKEGNFKSRAEVSQALGQNEPMHSEVLRDLQGKEPTTTGISQAVHEKRDTGVVPGEGAGPVEMIERGRKLLKSGADPEPIAQKVEQGKAITADETATLRAKVEELSKATDRSQDEADAKPQDQAVQKAAEDARKSENDFRERIKPAATEWAKTGSAYQGETDIDTGSYSGLRRAVQQEKGRDVTPSEAQKLRQTAKSVKEADTAETSAKSKFD